MMNKTLIFDIECDDLALKCTKIWCISSMWLEDEYAKTYVPEQFNDFFTQVKEADTIMGHGILSYDLLVLRKLLGVPFTVGPDSIFGKPVKFVDTLTLSRYLNPDRKAHSLEYYGQQLGYAKGDHSDWSCYSEDMAVYNRRDTILTKKVYQYLSKEMQ